GTGGGTIVSHPRTGIPFLILGLFLGAIILIGSIFAYVKLFGPGGSFELNVPKEPVTVHAGQSFEVLIGVERHSFKEPITLTFSHDPEIISAQETIPAQVNSHRVKFTIADEALAGSRKLTLTAKAQEGKPVERTVEINILPLATLPTPSGAGTFHRGETSKVIAVNGKKYYQEIYCLLADQTTKVPFVFVPWDNGRSFYIMKYKVWNELYHRFAEAHGPALAGSRWQLGARGNQYPLIGPDFLARLTLLAHMPWSRPIAAPCYEEYGEFLPTPNDMGWRQLKWPVLRVDLPEAHLCAVWLGGKVPSAEQWDKAAGALE